MKNLVKLLTVSSRLWRARDGIGTVQIPPLILLLVIGLGCSKAEKLQPDGTAPQRIVTLTPSGTEIVAAVGALDRLVGVDEFSTEPPAVVGLPKTGTFLEPSLEAILALRPDLVVVDRVQEKVVTPLARAGIATLVLEMHTVADVRGGMLAVGQAVGRADAARDLVTSIDMAIDGARARADAHRGERPVVLAVVDREVGALKRLVVAGPGSYIDELLAIVGADNAMAASGLRYSNIGAEQILRARPTVILDTLHVADPSAAVRDWQALPQVPAVAKGRVVPLTDRMFTSPSPRLAQALQQLERAIYGISPE